MLFPLQHLHPRVAVAHLYCVVFVVGYTSPAAAEPHVSVLLKNPKKYVALPVGVDVEGNRTETEKPLSSAGLFRSDDGLTAAEIRFREG